MSICTASYSLAAAGLLDGRPATTHWNRAEHFQRAFRAVRIDPGVLLVDDGEVLTASDVDLCPHLVRRDHGSAAANRVARLCAVPPWRDGGQVIDRPVPEPAVASTSGTRQWALGESHRPLTPRELAGHARMSVRTFTRRFREEAGLTPGQWLARERIRHARHLLETTVLPVDRVASDAGFGTAASLRHHLTRVIGGSPLAYRRSFHPGYSDAGEPSR